MGELQKKMMADSNLNNLTDQQKEEIWENKKISLDVRDGDIYVVYSFFLPVQIESVKIEGTISCDA